MHKSIRWFISIILLGFVISSVYSQLLHNYAYLLVLRGYVYSQDYGNRVGNLRAVLQFYCSSLGISCDTIISSEDTVILQSVDQYYIDAWTPLHVITQTAVIPAVELHLGGISEVNQTGMLRWFADGFVTMYAEGYLEARAFFLTHVTENWRIAITAQHDDPPPVKLELWLDNQLIGEFSFHKGDKSWESLSLNANISPGFHWIRVWYVDDYIDRESGLDRNAYIEKITLEKAGVFR